MNKPALIRAYECLAPDAIPPYTPGCEYCEYQGAVNK